MNPELDEIIDNLKMFDDTMARMVFENKACTQVLVNVVLDREDLVVKRCQTQSPIHNYVEHSVRLDVDATDSEGNRYDIEFQREVGPDLTRRSRFYGSLMTTRNLPKGEDYTAVQNVYVIFLCEKDPFRQREPIYHYRMRCDETGEDARDGELRIYVNAENQKKDALGSLMADLFQKDPSQVQDPVLRKEFSYFKVSEGGREKMSESIEEYVDSRLEEYVDDHKDEWFQEGIDQGEDRKESELVISMHKNGFSAEEISKYLEIQLPKVKAILASEKE